MFSDDFLIFELGEIVILAEQQVVCKGTPSCQFESFCQGLVWATHDVHHVGFVVLVAFNGCFTSGPWLGSGYLQARNIGLVPTVVCVFPGWCPRCFIVA